MTMAAGFLLILICAHFVMATEGSKLTALDFIQKNSSQVTIDNQREMNLTHGITICFRVRPKFLSGSDLVVNNGTIYIFMSDYTLPSIFVQLGNKSFFVPWPSSKIMYAPLVWYTFCLAYTTAEQNIIFVINEEKAMNSSSTEDIVAFDLKPTNTIGIRDGNPYVGSIADFNIWNQPLSYPEIHSFSDCDTADLFAPNRNMALRWSNFVPLNSSIRVKTFQTSYDDVCSNGKKVTQWWEFLHYQVALKEAIFLCDLLDGDLVYPRNQQDMEQIKTLLNGSKHAEACNNRVWIPIKRSKDDPTKWIYNASVDQVFLPWAKDQPNGKGLQNCITLSGDPPGYEDIECHELHCSVCNTRRYHYLNIRGSCIKDSRIDSKFVLLKNENEEFIFQGFSGKSSIIRDKDNDAWTLFIGEPFRGILVGTLKPNKTFPIGLHNWNIRDGYCDNENNGPVVPIKISRCQEDQFTCSDGTCISMLYRCDVYADCADRSDEEHCLFLVRASDDPNLVYDPPLTDRSIDGTQVNISMNITYVGDIDVMKMAYTVRFSLMLIWFDPRLKFNNLKNISNNFNYLNKEDKGKIWSPGLIFDNAVDETGLLLDDFASVTVLNLEEPKLSPPEDLYENEIYKGSENPLSYKRIYELELHCDFELNWFPFDYHHCFINISLPFDLEKIVQLVPTRLEYFGPKSLNQFKIYNKTMIGLADGSKIQVRITLQRVFVFHLTNTYMPGLCLVVIAEFTLYFKKSDLDVAMGLSLTIMLVVYTMYQSISQTLPQTAYIKFVDIFLIFGLLIPFTVFLLQVFSKIRMMKDKVGSKSASRATKFVDKVAGSAKIGIPVLSVLFLLCYVAAAYISYNNPDEKQA